MAVTLLQKWLLAAAIARHQGIVSAGVEVGLCLLNFHNNQTGQCNPSYSTIAAWTGLNRDTVIKGALALEAAGYLKIIRTIDKGEQASKGQRLPSNSFEFDFSRANQSEIPTTPSRKSRPPQSESPTTPVDNPDQPRSEIPAMGSRKSRPKHGNLETGKLETGKRTLRPGAEEFPLKRIADRHQFDEFFRQSPKQTKPEAAWLEYRRLIQEGQVTHEALLAGMMQSASEHHRNRTEDRFFPSPVQWLRDGRWNDRPVNQETRLTASDGIRSYFEGESIGDLVSRSSSGPNDQYLDLQANHEAD